MNKSLVSIIRKTLYFTQHEPIQPTIFARRPGPKMDCKRDGGRNPKCLKEHQRVFIQNEGNHEDST